MDNMCDDGGYRMSSFSRLESSLESLRSEAVFHLCYIDAWFLYAAQSHTDVIG
jgi:hypothetical protein